MNPVGFSPQVGGNSRFSGINPSVAASPKFSGFIDELKKSLFEPGEDEEEKRATQQEEERRPSGDNGKASSSGEGFSFGQRLKDGLGRMTRMTIARPLTTGVEFFLVGFLPLGLIFPAKHFIEGLLNVDSIFFKRRPWFFGRGLGLSGAIKWKRTLWDLIKGKPASQ